MQEASDRRRPVKNFFNLVVGHHIERCLPFTQQAFYMWIRQRRSTTRSTTNSEQLLQAIATKLRCQKDQKRRLLVGILTLFILFSFLPYSLLLLLRLRHQPRPLPLSRPDERVAKMGTWMGQVSWISSPRAPLKPNLTLANMFVKLSEDLWNFHWKDVRITKHVYLRMWEMTTHCVDIQMCKYILYTRIDLRFNVFFLFFTKEV